MEGGKRRANMLQGMIDLLSGPRSGNNHNSVIIMAEIISFEWEIIELCSAIRYIKWANRRRTREEQCFVRPKLFLRLCPVVAKQIRLDLNVVHGSSSPLNLIPLALFYIIVQIQIRILRDQL